MQAVRCGSKRSHCPRSLGVSLLTALLLVGCSGAQRAGPVDSSRAHEALKTVLDGWKKGDSPASLQSGSPAITVQDLDWLAGAKLVDYQIDGDGRVVETNLYVPVKLTVRTPQGKQVKKSVKYIVGTNPIVTVFRDFR